MTATYLLTSPLIILVIIAVVGFAAYLFWINEGWEE